VLAQPSITGWEKAGLQPTDGKNPDHVAIDETVIGLNGQRYWLYAAVDPATNQYLHVRLFTTRTQALTEMFLRELHEKHHVEEATFLVDGARGCRLRSISTASASGMKHMGSEMLQNVSSKN